MVSFFSYSDQAFETQTFRSYGLMFICILDKTCAVANAARQNLIRENSSPFDKAQSRCTSYCFPNLLPSCRAAYKCLHITCNSTYLLKAFRPIARLFVNNIMLVYNNTCL